MEIISNLRRLYKTLIAMVLALTVLIANSHEYPPKPGYLEPVSTQRFALLDALIRAQGIADDEESYYFSWNFGLTKTSLDGRTIEAQNLIAIPPRLIAQGCVHIGGITYYDGKVYAPIEDSKVFEHLYIATYDSETLALIDTYPLPLENHENGVPWCAADPDKGVIYSARRDHITTLNVYDAETLALIDTIELSAPVHKVQGGQVYEGVLYLSVSRDEHAIFAVKLSTGEVQKVFDRNLLDGVEGEGMTILKTPDGAFFHVLDIGKDVVTVNLRNYAFDPASLQWNDPV